MRRRLRGEPDLPIPSRDVVLEIHERPDLPDGTKWAIGFITDYDPEGFRADPERERVAVYE
jgi:hypothetical protein